MLQAEFAGYRAAPRRTSFVVRSRRAALLLPLALAACAPRQVEPPLPPHLQPGGEMPPVGLTIGMLTWSLTATPERPGAVRGRLVATNTSGMPIHTQLPGGCMMFTHAYLEGVWERPVWDAQRLSEACRLDAVILHLAAGEQSREGLWTYLLTHEQILGDSLPDGEYRIGARIYPDGEVGNGYVVVAETPVRLVRRP